MWYYTRPVLCPKFKPTMSMMTSWFEPTLVLILYRYLLWFQLCRWFYKEFLFCSQFKLLSVMKHLSYFNVVPTVWNILRRSSFMWSLNYMLLFTLILIVVWFLPYARFEINWKSWELTPMHEEICTKHQWFPREIDSITN